MKIEELDNEVFYNFATMQSGEDVSLYKADLVFEKTDSFVKLRFYIGGESDDERKFIFTDDTCKFHNGHTQTTIDLSRDWIEYLAYDIYECDEEANYFVSKYNSKIDSQIKLYAQQQASLKI